MANWDKIDEVLDFIERHPEQWDQAYWVLPSECGTTACVAGWAILLNGGKESSDVMFELVDGTTVNWSYEITQAAADILGLSMAQADFVFQSGAADATEMRSKIKTAIDTFD